MHLGARVPPDLVERLDGEAARLGKTRTAALIDILQAALNPPEPEPASPEENAPRKKCREPPCQPTLLEQYAWEQFEKHLDRLSRDHEQHLDRMRRETDEQIERSRQEVERVHQECRDLDDQAFKSFQDLCAFAVQISRRR